LKFKIAKNIYPINSNILAVNPYEHFNYLLGTLDGNIYKCSFLKPTDSNYDHIFNQSNGIVWRKAVRMLMCNMTEKEIQETKQYMDRFCIDKNIVDLNPDEFFKLKPDPNKLYKNALKSNYEKHISLITGLEYNYFIKNFFLSCSYDGSLRIYHQSFSVIIIEINLEFEVLSF
jgi:hypothetical protein